MSRKKSPFKNVKWFTINTSKKNNNKNVTLGMNAGTLFIKSFNGEQKYWDTYIRSIEKLRSETQGFTIGKSHKVPLYSGSA